MNCSRRTDLPVLLLHNLDDSWESPDLDKALDEIDVLETAIRQEGHPVTNVPVHDADVATRLVRALQAALDATRADPKRALAVYLKANPEVRKELDSRAFELTLGQFATTQTQSEKKWADFVAFAIKQEIISKPVEAASLFRNVLKK